MRKENNGRIYEIDFIRVIVSIGVVVFHWYRHFDNFLNLSIFGTAVNAIYFYISGYLLYSKYKNNCSDFAEITNFYKKRYLRIMPKYYTIWILAFLICSVIGYDAFSSANPTSIIFTILGLDGYLSVRYKTLYLIGDWFIGAIIILYIIFPCILYCYKKYKHLFVFAIGVCFFITKIFNIPHFSISYFSLIECLWYFTIGIELSELGNTIANKWVIVFSILCILLYCCFQNALFFTQLLYIALFILIFNVSSYLLSINNKFEYFFSKVSKSCLTFLLIHHLPMIILSKFYHPVSHSESFLILVVYFLLLILVTYIFDKIYNYLSIKFKNVLNNGKY